MVHLVLWFDGARFQALPQDEADAFAALPAEEARGGPRGATVSIGSAQEEALAGATSALQSLNDPWLYLFSAAFNLAWAGYARYNRRD